MTKAPTLAATVFAGLVLVAPLQASAQIPSERWTFSVMPYFWLPSVDGELNYGRPSAGGASANVSVDADTLLDNLDFAFMVAGEARKGRWLIGTDVIYLDFSKADSAVRSVDFNPGSGPVNVSTTALDAGTQSELTGWVWSLVGGYAVVQAPKASLDLIGGLRYLDLEAKTDWQLSAAVAGPSGTTTFAPTGSVEKSEDVWAAIVGARGRARLGDSAWFVNYYLDAGGDSSTFTWQGIAGLGYAFRWGEVVLDYRYLYFNQSGDGLIDDMSFGGFALGARFSF
jgi:opacity protein-like surface antigen